MAERHQPETLNDLSAQLRDQYRGDPELANEHLRIGLALDADIERYIRQHPDLGAYALSVLKLRQGYAAVLSAEAGDQVQQATEGE